jgi:hypothetical protein
VKCGITRMYRYALILFQQQQFTCILSVCCLSILVLDQSLTCRFLRVVTFDPDNTYDLHLKAQMLYLQWKSSSTLELCHSISFRFHPYRPHSRQYFSYSREKWEKERSLEVAWVWNSNNMYITALFLSETSMGSTNDLN